MICAECGHRLPHNPRWGCMAEPGDNGSGSVADAVFCKCRADRPTPTEAAMRQALYSVVNRAIDDYRMGRLSNDGVVRELMDVLEPLIRDREAKFGEDAADAWDDRSEENLHRLSAMALEKYRAGGPSMPAIWLRDRAAEHRKGQ